MILQLKDILVTQSGLRNSKQVSTMVEFVKNGGKFDKESMENHCKQNPSAHKGPIIQIAKFPDGKLYVADGHHRMLAIHLSGRDVIYSDEYTVVNWTYDEYQDINFDQKWVTPFDPRIEIRYPDFLEFKTQVYAQLKISRQAAADYINKHKNLYSRPRDMNSIEDMSRIIYEY